MLWSFMLESTDNEILRIEEEYAWIPKENEDDVMNANEFKKQEMTLLESKCV